MTRRRRADPYDETPDEALEQLRHEIRTEAARDALTALRAVCRDTKAAANARATAGAAIFRAAGLYEKSDDGDGKADHELTASELQRRIDRLEADARGLLRLQMGDDAAAHDTGDDGEGVFD